MATGMSDEKLHVLFGKVFLLELERGNLEIATVFARAFLLRGGSVAKRSTVRFARGARAASRSSRRHPR